MVNIPKTSKQVTLKFDFERISATQFKSGVDDFLVMLQDVSRCLVDEDTQINWEITVKSGSAQIVATPDTDDVDPRLIVDQGIQILENGADRPDFFSDSALRRLKSLASLSGEENKIKIGFNGTFRELTHKSVAHINELLGGKRKAFGSIDGKLNLIADRGGLRFEIADRLTGVNVRCYFNQDDVEQVVDSFRKRVRISGLLNYRKDGTIVSIRVDEFRIIEDKDRPNFHDMIGILSD